MELTGDVMRKTGESSLLAIEAAKASRGLDIGRDSGLFRVPKVVNFDAEAGRLDFEHFDGLVTLLDLAVRKDRRLAELLEKTGRALALVHEKLTLPETMKYELPPQWSGPAEQNVFIHGDFACINVCYHERPDELVIVDWSAAPLVGRTPTFGSRYFDILMFISSLFHGAPCREVLSWDAAGMSRAFLGGYRSASPNVTLSSIEDRARLICRLQRENHWRLARQKQLLPAAGYICCQMLMNARLRSFLHKCEL
jgi:hypothetical protein